MAKNSMWKPSEVKALKKLKKDNPEITMEQLKDLYNGKVRQDRKRSTSGVASKLKMERRKARDRDARSSSIDSKTQYMVAYPSTAGSPKSSRGLSFSPQRGKPVSPYNGIQVGSNYSIDGYDSNGFNSNQYCGNTSNANDSGNGFGVTGYDANGFYGGFDNQFNTNRFNNNEFDTNGFNNNGFNNNGFNNNGFNNNGFNNNGYISNRFDVNGIAANGSIVDAFDGSTVNGYNSNRLDVNGIAANRSIVDAFDGSTVNVYNSTSSKANGSNAFDAVGNTNGYQNNSNRNLFNATGYNINENRPNSAHEFDTIDDTACRIHAMSMNRDSATYDGNELNTQGDTLVHYRWDACQGGCGFDNIFDSWSDTNTANYQRQN